MDIELPGSPTLELLAQSQPAVLALRAALARGNLPPGLDPQALTALLALFDQVTLAAAEDRTDLTPSQAAERLRIARPSVMRLIARGDLPARRDGGHYVVAPRDVRAFQTRLAETRREALAALAQMTNEFGF